MKPNPLIIVPCRRSHEILKDAPIYNKYNDDVGILFTGNSTTNEYCYELLLVTRPIYYMIFRREPTKYEDVLDWSKHFITLVLTGMKLSRRYDEWLVNTLMPWVLSQSK